MGHVRRAVLVVAAMASCSCGRMPSSSPSPSPVAAPIPSPPPSNFGPVFTVSGVVRDGRDGSPLSGVIVTLDAITGGCADSQTTSSVIGNDTDANGFYLLVAPGGWFRFEKPGFRTLCGDLILRSDRSISVTLPREGCSASINDLIRIIATPGLTFVDFAWKAVNGAHDYLVQIGHDNGDLNYHAGVNSDQFLTPDVLTTRTGGAPQFRWDKTNAAPGDYFVEARAISDCGMGPLSNETSFKVTN